jgi:hypothetical protein
MLRRKDMKNIFDISPEEEQRQKEYELKCKEEFESLHLDYYKEYDYTNYYSFKSGLEHYRKSWGSEKLIYEYLSKERLQYWREWEQLYAVAYIEYVCDSEKLELPEIVDLYKGKKLDKLLFGEVSLSCYRMGMYNVILNTYKNRMKVFEKYNLIVSSDDIDTVVGGIHATS